MVRDLPTGEIHNFFPSPLEQHQCLKQDQLEMKQHADTTIVGTSFLLLLRGSLTFHKLMSSLDIAPKFPSASNHDIKKSLVFTAGSKLVSTVCLHSGKVAGTPCTFMKKAFRFPLMKSLDGSCQISLRRKFINCPNNSYLLLY